MNILDKITKAFENASKDFFNYLAFTMRDEAGVSTIKIRITILVKTESGLHFSELERHFDTDEFEKSYQEYIQRSIIEQAKDIIENEKKSK